MRRHTFGYDVLFFLAILATLFALAPGLTHLVEMPHKMVLSRGAYSAVQQVYGEWELFGIALLAQFVTLVMLTWRSAREYYVFRRVLAALVLMILAQLLFWLFAFPVNIQTADWTRSPADWQDLRRVWEYSHALGALCQLLGFCFLVSALFARVRAAGR